MTRAFRFGVNMITNGDRSAAIAKVRRAEELGYDVILVPDHLGMPAPFPWLSLAAEHTSRVRLGTFVLNAGFWNPVLLARDVFTLNTFAQGRLELGLGAGYVREEFEEAGLAWPRPGERVTHLTDVVHRMRAEAAKLGQSLRIVVGGNGDRVLRLAAGHADTVAFAGLRTTPPGSAQPMEFITWDELGERVEFVRKAADGRDYESNLLVQNVSDATDSAPDVPAMLGGTHEEIAAKVRTLRDRYGITYLTVLEPNLESFAPVIKLLREQ
ncbi:TIGR03621 family F420-dependent LLM class oxidoreductase [Kibdelosporangium phytohabitans]|uniref:Luciferase-like domain-containing protein n=1 Tax=Kibdelosporangium phytohabitans TaxID=860235 RepID=A0A0N9I9C8_9PSEU|nr:TIGR03621 family F420-dependent LLM class oxidoreductase [Kibdelosporangium phytohabitans]ALG11099.1 hypothetical protein AOZ06_33230 [Kibdelosporangium phytohabitans]MBE1462345.1 putative F420-dependent oxidoreductase [Kibdelosporangium phytohabitans]